VLIAQANFLLERGQTDRQTDATERYTHAGGYTARQMQMHTLQRLDSA